MTTAKVTYSTGEILIVRNLENLDDIKLYEKMSDFEEINNMKKAWNGTYDSVIADIKIERLV